LSSYAVRVIGRRFAETPVIARYSANLSREAPGRSRGD
jgi:hypothetical protein